MDIIANGKIFDVRDNGYIYLDGKRVSRQRMFEEIKKDIRNVPVRGDVQENEVLESAEEKVIETTIKGNKMTMEEKRELFGINRADLERKVGKCAYKPDSIDLKTGKHYAGSYLCNVNGKATVINELTYQGKLQISKPNTRALGFYMEELFNIADTKQIGEFTSIRKGTVTLDDIGTIEDAEELVDVVSVWRVKFADLDLVTFLNESTGEFMGTKLYMVYKAEQEARLKKPSMDEMFENLMAEELKDIEAGVGEDAEVA